MRTIVRLLFLGLCLVLNSAVQAQMPLGGQNQADILKLLGELPPEAMKKVEALGKILQQDLKEGKLDRSTVHEELMSGTFEQTLRDLNPEAGPLLDDIVQLKNHPNADSLPNLLDGMVGGAGRGGRAVPDGFASVPPGTALPGSTQRNPSGIPSAAI